MTVFDKNPRNSSEGLELMKGSEIIKKVIAK